MNYYERDSHHLARCSKKKEVFFSSLPFIMAFLFVLSLRLFIELVIVVDCGVLYRFVTCSATISWVGCSSFSFFVQARSIFFCLLCTYWSIYSISLLYLMPIIVIITKMFFAIEQIKNRKMKKQMERFKSLYINWTINFVIVSNWKGLHIILFYSWDSTWK